MRHTEGEWTWFFNEEVSCTIGCNMNTDSEEIIGVVFPVEVDKDTLDISQAEANAKLIAAAPDLLATCIKQKALMDEAGLIDEDLNNAITKATA
jgi:hypothetical protein